MRVLPFVILLLAFLAFDVEGQQRPTDIIGDVHLITPIVESPPMTAESASAFVRYQTLRNWGIKRLGLDSIMLHLTGKNVKVCICDTGASDHFALDSSVVASENFSPDPHANDENGHSTHVAGIIHEIAPDAQLLFAKVLSTSGHGSNRGVADGVTWCHQQGADVINMSLGSPEPSARLEKAIQAAVADSVIVVAAAGNSGQSADENRMGYPARYDFTIAVGSINYDLLLSYYSSSGSEGDVLAPGEKILSTWLDDRYIVLSGTSMAAPYVAGMAALRVERDGLTGVEEALLKATAVDIPPEGWERNNFSGYVSARYFEVGPDIAPPVDTPVSTSRPASTLIVILIVVVVLGVAYGSTRTQTAEVPNE